MTQPVVLIADDNLVNVKILRKTLEKKGIDVHVAHNGLAPLKMSRKRKFSIIMLDNHMPEMSGIDPLKEIRREEVNRETPCFCVTASSTGTERELVSKLLKTCTCTTISLETSPRCCYCTHPGRSTRARHGACHQSMQTRGYSACRRKAS